VGVVDLDLGYRSGNCDWGAGGLLANGIGSMNRIQKENLWIYAAAVLVLVMVTAAAYYMVTKGG
jgi:hypothetical protein